MIPTNWIHPVNPANPEILSKSTPPKCLPMVRQNPDALSIHANSSSLAVMNPDNNVVQVLFRTLADKDVIGRAEPADSAQAIGTDWNGPTPPSRTKGTTRAHHRDH